jgi:membrane protease YdiL (CAAX protease family)
MTDRRVPVGALVVPYVIQFVASIGAAVALNPPADIATGFYDPRFAVVILAGYAALIAAVVVLARTDDRPLSVVLAVRATAPGRTAAQVVLVVVGAAAVSLALEPIFHGVAEQGVEPGPFPGGASATIAVVLAVLGLVVVGPIAEEIYFRGLVQGGLAGRGRGVALIAPAVLFAVVHLTPAAIPVLLVYGLLLGALRARTASIVPCCIAHILNNGMAIAFALHSAA